MWMKKNILLFGLLILFFTSYAQDFSGQWKGIFTDKSITSIGGTECDYVLELECKGNSVKGSSYTYSSDGTKTYYSICSVVGFINRKQKYIEVKETERTKTNWPINVGNCLQVHRLTYYKQGDSAILKGDWEPAPDQGNCGYGMTVLNRRELKQSFPNLNAAAKKPFKQNTAPSAEKKSIAKKIEKIKPPVAKQTTPVAPKKIVVKPRIKRADESKTETATIQSKKSTIPKEDLISTEPVPSKDGPEVILSPKVKFEKRNNTVLETISVKNKCVKVDLYDNGEVDGDSISLFYNGKLLMSSKRLSEKPISLTINVEDDTVNELVMYAENLGTIPPNTALMVVTDGPRRYEVRITSDLQKSGVIDFIHKAEDEK